ncbi:hypothetical protein BCR43DRAFT_509300 [Syncephalastrum racemosum]|uniref:Uncharacterized protein n=1 Tax=Syncephalastrum racemosum TaxID=13706 RepID=A0A1X2H046_SYNRA|nr:hypothetical protein BCR43DRAFT_509296 [Syncephalastrum racemosum]ORY89193.1 hypothetical protein BCR43DRAFT_509300 [Syncephalastrum racemosum]
MKAGEQYGNRNADDCQACSLHLSAVYSDETTVTKRAVKKSVSITPIPNDIGFNDEHNAHVANTHKPQPTWRDNAMRHKEVDIRFNDEPIAELANAKRRSQGSAFCSAPPALHSPIFHPGSIPAGDIAFDGEPQVISTEKAQSIEMQEEYCELFFHCCVRTNGRAAAIEIRRHLPAAEECFGQDAHTRHRF